MFPCPLHQSSGHPNTVIPIFYIAANDDSGQVQEILHSMVEGNSVQDLLKLYSVTENHPTPQLLLHPASEGCPGGGFLPSPTGKDRVGRPSAMDGQEKGQRKHSVTNFWNLLAPSSSLRTLWTRKIPSSLHVAPAKISSALK